MDKIKAEQNIEVKTLDAEPEIRQDLLWVWETFCALDRARGTTFTGGGVVHNPITHAEIYYYCVLNCITDARSKMRLSRFIPAMDKVYMIDHIDSIVRQNKKAAK